MNIEEFKKNIETNSENSVNETINISLEDLEKLKQMAKDNDISLEAYISYILHCFAQDCFAENIFETIKEKEVLDLLKQYENAEISTGKIAEKLGIDREEVWKLLEKHNIDLVDYDFSEDEKAIEKFINNK